MSEDTSKLRNRVSRLEDQIEHVVETKLEAHEETISEQQALIDELEEEVAVLQERVEAIIDVDNPEDSTPDARAVALREAMIRASGNSAGSISGGVTWWWQETRDQLASHGHSGFSKPTYHTAMEDATEEGGFVMTTKEVVLDNGQRREVKAIRLDPSGVTSPRLRNQLTTGGGVDGGSKTAAPDGGTVNTDD